MYLSVRYVSMPATDPQQAQTQRMMAVISPLMLGYLRLAISLAIGDGPLLVRI